MYNVEDMVKTEISRGINDAKLLKIACLAANNDNWKKNLDQIFQFVRPLFIFDNVVIYLPEIETKRLEALYARATGRGKSAEADATWGESIANRVVEERKTVLESPDTPVNQDRLASPFILGYPLSLTKSITGALIVIRFGGPEFKSEEIKFARFFGEQISLILKGKCLEDLEKELEAQRNIKNIQDDFINTISHELRSPLGFITGYTTTLLRKDTNWDHKTQNDFLEIIERESNNLTELIDNLLDSSRLQSGQMRFDFQPIRLDSIIRDEVNRSAITHPGQLVNLNFSDQLPAIQGDSRRLAQVFDNLLSNSHKYAPESEINISVYPVKSDILIEYSDSGPGINEKYLPHVFSRFFRDPEHSMKARGSGLGLSICKQIIESHNGSIRAASPPGRGLLFSITLPSGNN